MREVSELSQMFYLLGSVCLAISVVYLIVGLFSKYNIRKKSAYLASALFSGAALLIGFGMMTYIILLMLGVVPTIAFSVMMMFPLYAVYVTAKINIKLCAIILTITAVCFIGVTGDYSSDLNVFTIAKTYIQRFSN